MKRILVPLDFSDTSKNALKYSLHLFAESPLRVTILHTYRPPSTAFTMKSMDNVMETDSHRQLDAIIATLEKQYVDVLFEKKVVKSDAVPCITELGDSGKYDYIVMGTKGASGLKEVFIGSVAGGVIAGTDVPVIVVPTGFTYQPVDTIVLAISDHPFSSPSVVEPLRELLRLTRSKLDVLHVADEKTPDVDEVLQPVDDLDPSVHYAFGSGDINERMDRYIEEQGGGMLCLVRESKGFFGRLFGESVTLKQTFHSSVPLLILHD